MVDRQAALTSLRALALGDAFGQTWFAADRDPVGRRPGPGPWEWTDDTAMAVGMVRMLRRRGRVDQDELAEEFARNYVAEPHRGYGASMHDVLTAVHEGEPWREVARRQFDGQGSWGNGAAMRVAPLGAWFADDVKRLVLEAARSAQVTHAHPEGMVGAVAVALAAGYAVRGVSGDDLLVEVATRLPDSLVHRGLERARRVPFDTDPRTAGAALGVGQRISAPDTVPFALWCAARHVDDLVEALWSTAAAGGDVDTTCAIVAGVVGARTGLDDVPADWLEACESLPGDLVAG